jgi:hypothetical protein
MPYFCLTASGNMAVATKQFLTLSPLEFQTREWWDSGRTSRKEQMIFGK